MMHSNYTLPKELPLFKELPSFFDAFASSETENLSQWEINKNKLRNLYAHYMYGPMPDTKDETISYRLGEPETVDIVLDDSYPVSNVSVRRLDCILNISKGGRSAEFKIVITLPLEESSKTAYPLYSEMCFFPTHNTAYAAYRGYASASFVPMDVASDNLKREGAFYTLYPYGDTFETQTGALMAWGWGAGKILDAMEAGLAQELNIDYHNNILTGVSRYGKATAVAGAFDERIKVTVPTCSGAGGMASFRYISEGKTYDLSSVGFYQNGTHMMTLGKNEPLEVLQCDSERHWFNETFREFTSPYQLPFDQHFLAALMASEDRYLMIISGHNGEDWTNPPAMAYTYLAAREIYRHFGVEDHLTIHIHENNIEPSGDFKVRRGPCPNHAVLAEDMVYLLDYCDFHLFGKKDITSDLSLLKTCAFFEAKNWDPAFDKFATPDEFPALINTGK